MSLYTSLNTSKASSILGLSKAFFLKYSLLPSGVREYIFLNFFLGSSQLPITKPSFSNVFSNGYIPPVLGTHLPFVRSPISWEI